MALCACGCGREVVPRRDGTKTPRFFDRECVTRTEQQVSLDGVVLCACGCGQPAPVVNAKPRKFASLECYQSYLSGRPRADFSGPTRPETAERLAKVIAGVIGGTDSPWATTPTYVPAPSEEPERHRERVARASGLETVPCPECGRPASLEEVTVHRPGRPSVLRTVVRCLSVVGHARVHSEVPLPEPEPAPPPPAALTAKPRTTRHCRTCGCEFTPNRVDQLRCSKTCRKPAVRMATCRDCSREFECARLGTPAERCPACRSQRNINRWRERRRQHRLAPQPPKEVPTMHCQDCGTRMVGVHSQRRFCDECRKKRDRARSLDLYHRKKAAAAQVPPAAPEAPAPVVEMPPPSPALLEVLASPPPAPAPALQVRLVPLSLTLRPCGECQMFVPGEDWGSCHRRAPIVVGPELETVWPVVSAEETGCGEFVPRSLHVVEPDSTAVEVR